MNQGVQKLFEDSKEELNVLFAQSKNTFDKVKISEIKDKLIRKLTSQINNQANQVIEQSDSVIQQSFDDDIEVDYIEGSAFYEMDRNELHSMRTRLLHENK